MNWLIILNLLQTKSLDLPLKTNEILLGILLLKIFKLYSELI